MNRRTFIKTTLAAAAVSGMQGPPAPAVCTAEKYEWKMASAVPPDLPGAGTNCVRLADTICRMSGGRIRIKVFGPGELAPAFETLDAVSRGQADLGYGSPYYWRGKHEAFVFCTNIPFGLNAREILAWIQFGNGEALLDELYGQFCLKFFPAGNTGAQMGGWYNKEIHSLADYKGLKIRMPGLGGEILARAGAEIVTLPPDKILRSLKTGVIEAAEWVAPFDDLNLKLYEAAKYYYWPGWQEPGAMADLFINKKLYESLPEDIQEIIRQASLAAYSRMWSEYSAKNAAALTELVRVRKVQLRSFPDRIIMELARMSRDVISEIAARDPLSKKIFESYTAFARQSVGWTQIGEEAFSLARSLTSSYL